MKISNKISYNQRFHDFVNYVFKHSPLYWAFFIPFPTFAPQLYTLLYYIWPEFTSIFHSVRAVVYIATFIPQHTGKKTGLT